MFRFTDEPLMVRQMVRKWVEAKLRPANDSLERGEQLPYDLFRDFMKTFGIPDMVRPAWFSIFGPGGMAPALAQHIQADCAAVLAERHQRELARLRPSPPVGPPPQWPTQRAYQQPVSQPVATPPPANSGGFTPPS